MYLNLFIEQPGFGLLVAFVLSLMVGSFLNVVIYRLPEMMRREWESECQEYLTETSDEPANQITTEQQEAPLTLSTPASTCPSCQHKIRWYENIPALSYIALRGKCSQCSAKISARYPIIELLTAFAGSIPVYIYGLNDAGITLMLATWVLIALTFIDIDHQLLPDKLTLPLLWLGLLVNSFGTFTSLHHAVWGAIAGYLCLWSVYWVFKLLTGKEGMGYGDFKLLAALGAWTGITMLPQIILISSVVGVVLAFILMAVNRHKASNPLPFGPYLAIAGWIAMLWGHEINHWYLSFLTS